MKRLLIIALCAAALTASGCGSSTASMKSTKSGSSTGLIWIGRFGEGRVLVTDENRGLSGAATFWADPETTGRRLGMLSLVPMIYEVKPAVWHRKRVLLVARYPGDVIILREADQRVAFRTGFYSAFSAEALPDGALVMVNLAAEHKPGIMRVLSTETRHFADYPVSAYGVAWDKVGNCLWVLADDAIRRYEYNFDAKNPALTPRQSFALPAKNPCDLYPRAGRRELIVSTAESVWTFNPEDGGFAPFGPVADARGPLAVGEKDLNGRILYAFGWSPGGNALCFANPRGMSQDDKVRLVRARWDRLPEFTYGF